MSFNYIKTITADVIVFGAGPAGIAAAYTAGKEGKSVYLVEMSNKIGGVMATCPGMMLGGGYPRGKSIGGFFGDFVSRMENYNPPKAERRLCSLANFGDEIVYDHEYAIYFLYEMLSEANVHILLNTIPLNLKMQGDEIKEVELVNSQGCSLYKAKMFIDCTGNGDLAVKAGVPYELGDESNALQASTMTFYMENVNCDIAFADKEDPYFTKYSKIGIEKGLIDKTLSQMYMLKGFRDNSVYFNAVAVCDVDPSEPQTITQGSAIGRKRIVALAEFCQNNIPGFENSYLSLVGPLVGVRESRRLKGSYVLTIDDIRNAKKFDDGVVACDNPLDIAFRSEDNAQYSHEAALVDGYYTIPFRCLMTDNIKNLMFAGRMMSADILAFSSIRGMPTCMNLGQSTGIAASIAIDKNLSLQELNCAEIVKKMIEYGASGIGDNSLD